MAVSAFAGGVAPSGAEEKVIELRTGGTAHVRCQSPCSILVRLPVNVSTGSQWRAEGRGVDRGDARLLDTQFVDGDSVPGAGGAQLFRLAMKRGTIDVEFVLRSVDPSEPPYGLARLTGTVD